MPQKNATHPLPLPLFHRLLFALREPIPYSLHLYPPPPLYFIALCSPSTGKKKGARLVEIAPSSVDVRALRTYGMLS